MSAATLRTISSSSARTARRRDADMDRKMRAFAVRFSVAVDFLETASNWDRFVRGLFALAPAHPSLCLVGPLHQRRSVRIVLQRLGRQLISLPSRELRRKPLTSSEPMLRHRCGPGRR
jgi:hypothetical protein